MPETRRLDGLEGRQAGEVIAPQRCTQDLHGVLQLAGSRARWRARRPRASRRGSECHQDCGTGGTELREGL